MGYRAHQFRPVWGPRQENCLRLRLVARTQLQFERNYYLLPELEAPARDQRITWLVQRSGWSDLDARGLPDYLRFDEDDLLLLEG